MPVVTVKMNKNTTGATGMPTGITTGMPRIMMGITTSITIDMTSITSGIITGMFGNDQNAKQATGIMTDMSTSMKGITICNTDMQIGMHMLVLVVSNRTQLVSPARPTLLGMCTLLY